MMPRHGRDEDESEFEAVKDAQERRRYTLQNAATQRNTLQHPATPCNTLHKTATQDGSEFGVVKDAKKRRRFVDCSLLCGDESFLRVDTSLVWPRSKSRSKSRKMTNSAAGTFVS